MRQVVGGYTQVIIHTKTTSADPDPCVRWQANIPKWLSVQRQHLLILTYASGDRRIYPSDYPYKDNICWSWPMRQVVGRYTQVIIRTKTTSADPDPCIRWQVEIPRVVIRTNTTSVNPYPCVRWQAETPKGYPYTHLCYPDLWEVR